MDQRPREDRKPSHIIRRAREGVPVHRPRALPEEEKEGWPAWKRILVTFGAIVGGIIVLAVLYLVFLRDTVPLPAGLGGTPAAGTVPKEPPTADLSLQFLPAQDREEPGWDGFKTLVGDVNGDGRADLIWNLTQESNRVYVGLAQEDGSFDFLPAQERSEKRWSGFQTFVGDVNGDGRADLIWNETQENNRVYVGLAQQDGSFDFLPAQDRSEKRWSGFQTFVGDANGDGRADLFWNETAETNRIYVALAQEDGSFQFLPAQDHTDKDWGAFKTLIGDVNGDGQSDLIWNMTQETNRVYVGLSKGDGSFEFLPAQDHTEKGWAEFETLTADMNGDGRTDLVWNRTEDTNRVYVALAGEDGSFDFRPAQDHSEQGWGGFQTLVGDVDGDRRADLIWNATQETNRVYLALSNGDGTFLLLPAQDHSEQGWAEFKTRIGDVNGDGRADLIWNRTRETNRVYVGLSSK